MEDHMKPTPTQAADQHEYNRKSLQEFYPGTSTPVPNDPELRALYELYAEYRSSRLAAPTVFQKMHYTDLMAAIENEIETLHKAGRS